MGRISKKERRRIRQIKKQKETSRRRHEEQAFFGAFRRMCQGGWGPPQFEEKIREIDDPEAYRFYVEAIFQASGIRAGDEDSWHLIARTLEERGAPLDEILNVLHRWMKAHPRDPRPHIQRVKALSDWGLHDRARIAAQEALESSARDDLPPGLVAFYRSIGLPLREAQEELNVLFGRPPAAGRRRATSPRPPHRQASSRFGRPKASQRSSEKAADGPRAQKRGLTLQEDENQKPAVKAPVSFIDEPDTVLLEKLCSGPHDDLAAIDLASRGVEILAEDHFDRLLSLPSLRGVQDLGYQFETVLRVLKRFHGRVLLADEVGLGKTIEACLVLKEYMIRGQVRRALILVPPALVGQWQSELEEKFGITAQTTQDALLRRDPGSFWRGGPVLIASLALARQAVHREPLLRERFDLVIIDEAHHVKNRSTKSWELVNGLRSRFFLMLTATPVETNLTELYNLITLLRPGTLGTEGNFRWRFVRADDPTRPRNPEKLRELLREVMIRNTRARCGVLLPPRTARTFIVQPSAGEEELYRLVMEAARLHGISSRRTLFRTLLEEAGSSPLAVAETASRVRKDGMDPEISRVLESIEEAARSIRSTTKLERLEQLLPGDKVLVFSRFRGTTDLIAEDLRRRDIAFASFHGGMGAEEKDRAVAAFKEPGTDVLLCSEIGGEGRNLQFCHRLINFDLPWNPMKIEQRIGRIHRIGQTDAVEVTNLACAGTAEDRILDILDRRLNLFELVIGEMDLLLGEVADDREFEEQVFAIYAESKEEGDIEKGFNLLADRLSEGKRKLEKTKALDEALFGEDYET